jgi:hypothetical protein
MPISRCRTQCDLRGGTPDSRSSSRPIQQWRDGVGRAGG